MADKIRVNFPQMEEMAMTFGQSAAQMEELQGVVKDISGAIAEGILLGVAGDSYVEAVNGPLTQALAQLQESLTELENGIRQTAEGFQQESVSIAGKFEP